jgi:hypothetical protein
MDEGHDMDVSLDGATSKRAVWCLNTPRVVHSLTIPSAIHAGKGKFDAIEVCHVQTAKQAS